MVAVPAPSKGISKTYIVVGIVTLVALLAMLLVNLLGKSSTGVIDSAPPGPGGGPAALPSLAPLATAAPPEIFEVFEGRDPFRPLVVENLSAVPAASVAPAPSGGPVATPTTPVGVTPGRTPAPTAAPSSRAPDAVQIEVLSISQDAKAANVRIGNRVHEDAKAGDDLSSGVHVELVEPRCVTFVRNSSKFRLCEGDSVQK